MQDLKEFLIAAFCIVSMVLTMLKLALSIPSARGPQRPGAVIVSLRQHVNANVRLLRGTSQSIYRRTMTLEYDGPVFLSQTMANFDAQGRLIVALRGPEPEGRGIPAFDLGGILMSTQRMLGAVSSFEVGWEDSQLSELRRTLDHIPPYVRRRLVEAEFLTSRRGSLELVLGVVVLEEICREFQNGQLAAAFLTNVFAGLFNSILIAAGRSVRERLRRPSNIPSSESLRHDEALASRVHPDLVHLVSKMGHKTGVDRIRLRAEVKNNEINYDLEITQHDQRQILLYADRKVAPASEYRGFLRALNLEDRDGVLVDSYSGNRFRLEIPIDDVCQQLAPRLNQEVVVLASMRTSRNIEDSRLRDSLIVHSMRAGPA